MILDDGAVSEDSSAQVRLSVLISGLLLMMTEFQTQPCADRARLIARRLVVLSEHGTADPVQRELARALAEHWLRVVQEYSVSYAGRLN